MTAYVPNVGDIVEYGLDSFGKQPQTWRVKSWLKRATKLMSNDEKRKLGMEVTFSDEIDEILRDGCRPVHGDVLQWCLRDEAEFVSLTSICGTVAPIGKCRFIKVVEWPQHMIDQAIASAERLGRRGERLF